MLEFLNWLLEHAAGLISVGAILTALAGAIIWVVRVLISRELKTTIADVAEIKKVFMPVNQDGSAGVPLAATLQQMASAFTTTAKNFNDTAGTLKRELELIRIATQGNTARQRALLASSPVPTFEADGKGDCVWANGALLNLLERSFDDIRGRGWAVAIHRDDRVDGVSEWDAAVREHRIYESAYRVIARNSGKIWKVKCSATPLFCDTNAMTGYLGRYESVQPEVTAPPSA